MWWDELNRIGPLYGYYPNASKTCLIAKPAHENAANEIFAGYSMLSLLACLSIAASWKC